MDRANFTGHENGYGLPGIHGSPGTNMMDLNHKRAFSQQENIVHSAYSAYVQSTSDQHAPMTSQSSSRLPQSIIDQEQAESLPHSTAAQGTPHGNGMCSHQSGAMSCGPSQMSQQSCGDDHRQYDSPRIFTPLDTSQNDFSPSVAHMTRSFSDRPTMQDHLSHLSSPVSQPFPFSPMPFAPSPVHMLYTGLPVTPQHSPSTPHLDEVASSSTLGDNWVFGASDASPRNFGQTFPR